MPSDLSPQRMSIEQFNNQVRIRIPGARHKEHTLLLSIQSVALALSGPVVCCLATQVMLSLLETNDAASLVFGLACVGGLVLSWPVAAVSLVYSLLWETRGVETLTLSSDGITRELTPAPLIRGKRHFAADGIRSLNLLERPTGGLRPFRQIDSAGYGFGKLKGRLALEYDGATVELGNGLSNEEAQHVLATVQEALEADAVPIDPSVSPDRDPIPNGSSALPSLRLSSFVLPWSIGVALGVVALASPHQVPLIALVLELEPATGSGLAGALAILLGRLIAGGLFGIAIGYMQARGLSKLIPNGKGWIVACSVSYALADVANVLILGRVRELLVSMYSAFDLAISDAPSEPILAPLAALISFLGISLFFAAPYGVLIAVPQWIYLRKKVLRPWRWLVAYPAAFSVALGLSFAFAWLVGVILFGGSQLGDTVVLRAMQVIALIIFPVPAAVISAAGMLAIARNPAAQATQPPTAIGG